MLSCASSLDASSLASTTRGSAAVTIFSTRATGLAMSTGTYTPRP